ncbi:MAG: hypothetical protein HY716_11890 [Planctomycetes bacterium]|nr:hypothetical protein [Planctomycetota bacterium]
MIAIKGKVEKGSVRLARKRIFPEGQRVIVIPVPVVAKGFQVSTKAEQEDVEFVRATRGRLARHLKFEERADA